MTKHVKELDIQTQRLLTASVAIPSLTVLLQELVYNSIDNGATCVAVRVNLDRYSRLQVVDNGEGVKNLQELCSKPLTNKRKISRSLYGTRRGCLQHIVTLCEKVSITSRRHNSTYNKTFTSYADSEFTTEKHNRPSCGTTVSIDNIFSQMPVRCVSMSYMDLGHAKDMLMDISVANPRVAITLKDTKSGTIIFHSNASKTRAYNFMQFCNESIEFEHLKEVKYQVDDYKLDALFSLQLSSKPKQMVFVNRRPISDVRIKTFASDILLSALGCGDKGNSENKYPVFVVCLSCKPVYVDMCYESNNYLQFKNWDTVFNLIYNAIYSFLEEEEISIPSSEDDNVSCIPTPRIPLKTMLASASPTFNVKSDKAERPKRTEYLQNAESNDGCKDIGSYEKDNETPKKTPKKYVPMKRIPPFLKLSPVKKAKNNPKTTPSKIEEINQSSFKTPPPKRNKRLMANLQNAPVLNHLIEAKLLLDDSENVLDKENCILGSGKHSLTKALADISSKYSLNRRRSSTPLFPQKRKLPKLTISPIQFSKFEHPTSKSPKTSPIKNKKRKRTSSKSKKKSRSKNDYDRFMSQDSAGFHIETPSHILDKHKFACQNKENVIPMFDTKRSDSGYDTRNFTKDKENDAVYSNDRFLKHKPSKKDNCKEINLPYHQICFIEDSQICEKPEEASVLSPPKQPFEIFHDESVKMGSTVIGEQSKVMMESEIVSKDEASCSLEPARFEVYQDEPVTVAKSSPLYQIVQSSATVENEVDDNENEVDDNDNEVDESSVHEASCSLAPARFEVYQDTEAAQQQHGLVKFHDIPYYKSEIKTRDCGSSPIRIPVDRGCSPIIFSQQIEVLSAECEKVETNDSSVYNICEQGQLSDLPEPARFEVYQDNPASEQHISCGQVPIRSEQTQQSLVFEEFGDIDLDNVGQGEGAEQQDTVTKPDNKDIESEDILSTQDVEINSPCVDCNTQQLKRRLDFSTQKQPAMLDSILGEGPKIAPLNPEFEVAVPVNAANHIVADCSHWNYEKSKVVLLKSSSFDLRKWNNPVFETHGEGFVNTSSNAPFNMKILLDACKFDKSVFDGIKVLGQIDNKFIGCTTKDDLLIIVDQHAAHERIRLECMLKTLHVDGEVTNPVISQALPHPIPVKVTRHQIELIASFLPKLRYSGFLVDLSRYHCNLVELPQVCFTESAQLNMSVDDVIAVFTQLLDQITESEGSDLSLPQKLADYLHSKSCHGAIRFGDELTIEQCNILIKQLGYCDLPFQCAHGRPSFAPIINLGKQANDQRHDYQELNFMKLRSRFK